MKKFCLYFALAFAALGVFEAEAAYRSVVVQRRDGSSLKIGLQDNMTAKIADGSLVFSCAQGDITIPAEDVWHWSFSADTGDNVEWSGIKNAGVAEVVLVREPGRIVLRNIEAGKSVTIVSVDGRVVLADIAADSQVFVIDTNQLPAGVYILSYDSHSLKFVQN